MEAQTCDTCRVNIKIMKPITLIVIMLMCVTGCSAQEEQKKERKGDEAKKEAPKVSWKVEKEVDDEGNIIRYDSVYSWSYTDLKGDSVTVAVDSLLNAFRSYFDEQISSRMRKDDFVRPLWDDDSLVYRDFFRRDYFEDRWRSNLSQMEEMFKRMDSIRDQFFQEAYPGLIEPREQN